MIRFKQRVKINSLNTRKESIRRERYVGYWKTADANVEHNIASEKLWINLFKRRSLKRILENENWKTLGFDNNSFKRFVCVVCGEPVRIWEIEKCGSNAKQLRCENHRNN